MFPFDHALNRQTWNKIFSQILPYIQLCLDCSRKHILVKITLEVTDYTEAGSVTACSSVVSV